MNAATQSTTLLERRQRAVAGLLGFTKNTHLAADRYERKLLEQFAQGRLSIDEVLERLETRAAYRRQNLTR